MIRMRFIPAILGLAAVGAAAIAGTSQIQTVQAQAPLAPSSARVQAGQEVFQHNCLQCHSVYEGQTSFGPNLHGEMKRPHPKKSAAEIREILKNGKGKMPSFAGRLTASDTDDLIAYLRTL